MYHICINKDYGYNDTEGGGGGIRGEVRGFQGTKVRQNTRMYICTFIRRKKLIAVDQINGIYDVIMTVV